MSDIPLPERNNIPITRTGLARRFFEIIDRSLDMPTTTAAQDAIEDNARMNKLASAHSAVNGILTDVAYNRSSQFGELPEGLYTQQSIMSFEEVYLSYGKALEERDVKDRLVTAALWYGNSGNEIIARDEMVDALHSSQYVLPAQEHDWEQVIERLCPTATDIPVHIPKRSLKNSAVVFPRRIFFTALADALPVQDSSDADSGEGSAALHLAYELTEQMEMTAENDRVALIEIYCSRTGAANEPLLKKLDWYLHEQMYY